MQREIVPGIHWIQECGPDRTGIAAELVTRGETWYPAGRPLHIPQNAYLIRDDRSLLFDTLSPAAGEQLLADLDVALSGAPLDYLVVSHPDVPHAGNTHRVLQRYPDCRLVAPAVGDLHALYHLEDSLKVAPGDQLDLGGRRVAFHEATFLDAAMSVWMSEETSGLFMPVDFLGFPHLGGECLRFEDELDADVGLGRLTEFHSRVMFWFQYVDVPKVQAEIDRLGDRFEGRMIGPSHGLVIRRNPARFYEMMKVVVERVASAGRVGVL